MFFFFFFTAFARDESKADFKAVKAPKLNPRLAINFVCAEDMADFDWTGIMTLCTCQR